MQHLFNELKNVSISAAIRRNLSRIGELSPQQVLDDGETPADVRNGIMEVADAVLNGVKVYQTKVTSEAEATFTSRATSTAEVVVSPKLDLGGYLWCGETGVPTFEFSLMFSHCLKTKLVRNIPVLDLYDDGALKFDAALLRAQTVLLQNNFEAMENEIDASLRFAMLLAYAKAFIICKNGIGRHGESYEASYNTLSKTMPKYNDWKMYKSMLSDRYPFPFPMASIDVMSSFSDAENHLPELPMLYSANEDSLILLNDNHELPHKYVTEGIFAYSDDTKTKIVGIILTAKDLSSNGEIDLNIVRSIATVYRKKS